MFSHHFLVSFALAVVFNGHALGDALTWEPLRGSLEKADFNSAPATYKLSSAEGTEATFRISHLGTSPGLFSYSKWEIDRWGDPEGVLSDPGSWQVLTNASNDVAFALWGYWGNGGTPLAIGNTTSYEVRVLFDRPVEDLSFLIHGVDALTTATGDNAFDSLTIVSKFEGIPQVSPLYSNEGTSFTRSGDTLTGHFSQPLGTDSGNRNTSDDGSVRVTFAHVVDEVVLTYVAEAFHPSPPQFQDGVQNWSFSLGDFTFEPLPTAGRSHLVWAPLQGSLEKPGYTDARASFQANSDAGIAVDFTLKGLGTTANKFSYSKWEIDRWGDPNGELTPEGSWQAVSNGFNDVVLALWGYWGTSGASVDPPLEVGDKTTYRLTMDFSGPVTDLQFQLNAINALLQGGFNSVDTLTVSGYLDGDAQPIPNFSNEGGGFNRSVATLIGDFAQQIGGGFQNVTDDGSVDVRFPGVVDRVIITLVCKAENPEPAQFQDGQQNWSFSVGDLSFVPGIRTSIVWAPSQGQLEKPGFNNAFDSFDISSQDNGVTATFDYTHLGTTDDKFGYSKWEINRWGDPLGTALPLGSWQVISNAANDIMLGMWGYWGNDNSPGSPPVAVGDQTSYAVRITFDQPVDNLEFFLAGINALIKPVEQFNSFDIFTIESSLQSLPQGAPVYTQEGDAFTRAGNVLTGDFDNMIVDPYGGQHVSDAGSLKVKFTETVDEVRLILLNEAQHPDPAMFGDGLQVWSFSLSDLTFEYQGEGTETEDVATYARLPSASRLSGLEWVPEEPGFGRLRLTETLSADESSAWFLESSSDLLTWQRHPESLTNTHANVELSLPQIDRRHFYRLAKVPKALD